MERKIKCEQQHTYRERERVKKIAIASIVERTKGKDDPLI